MSNWSPVYLYKKLVHRIQSDEDLNRILRNTSWLFADRIVRMGLGVIIIVWIARYLGPEQFGIYNYAIAFAAIFNAFAALGLDNIVVRDIVRYPERKNEILGSALCLKLIASIVSFGLVVALIFTLRPDDPLTRSMVIIIAGTMVFQSFDIIDFWFQSQVRSKYTVIAKNIAFLFIAGLHIGLLVSGAPLIAFAWARLGEIFLFAIGLLFFYQYTGSSLSHFTVRIEQAKNLLRNSWPLILSGVMIMIYMRIDQVMLGEMIGDESVGIYSAAIRLSEVWYFIPTAILISVFPTIIKTQQADTGLYYRRLQRLYNIMTWLGIGIALPITVIASPLIAIIYGGDYEGASAVLVITIWSGVFVFQGMARTKWLITENLQNYLYLFTGAGGIANIILNLVFIPLYEEVGAAFASLLSQFLVAIIVPFFFKKTRLSAIMLFKSFVWGKHETT